MAERVRPWPLPPPPAPARVPDPIEDRPPIGTKHERAAALLYLSAALHMRRVEEMCSKFEKGALLMQMTLASGEDDLVLIGKLQGRMARTALELIGVGADEVEPSCPEGQVG